MNTHQHKHQNGFALLLTLVVISVVLAIGLSLLNITVKQFTLSSTIRDSEIAFFAANTGIECVQFAVANNRTEFFNGPGNDPDVQCGDYTQGPTDADPIANSNGSLTKYTYEFEGVDECIEVTAYTFDATGNNMTHTFTGEGLTTGSCTVNGQCTYLFSRGYNRACDERGSLRVVQREIAVDF